MEATSVDKVQLESGMIPPKRIRKDPDATTGKSVVVLRTRDVRVRDDLVFMPNTIEMAQLKKQIRGQFKTNIRLSSQMSPADVKHILMENFPILKGERFYCASVVDNRTRLEFHGERRIWDGHFIKKTIKGNSALYVFIEEDHQQEVSEPDSGGSEVVEDSGYESSIRERLGVKRSFDQITTRAESSSSVSLVKMSLSSMNSPGQSIHEKLPDVVSTHDGPPGNNTSYSNLVSGQAEKGSEKSDMSVQQETAGPNNTILFLPQPLSVGGIPIFMIPTAGGFTVAPAAIGGNNALNTVPTQQSVEMPLLPASNSPGLPSAPQASTLAPQLQSLDISSVSSQPSQNVFTAEASILESSEALTTVDTTEISQLVSLTGPEGDRTDSVGDQQETGNFKSPDQEQANVEETDSSQVVEKESAGAVAASGNQGSSGPFTLQTSESEPLYALDSGFETSGKPEDNSVQDVHSTTAGAAMSGNVFAKNVMLLKKEDLVQGNGKILMPTTIEMARMRKTGQYKRQVQFSKSMSEEAVRKTIQEVFPILHGRFSCASISNQDSTLQFHGSPRVWDGRTIRRILKGNSALYIVMEEIQVPPRTVIDQIGLSILSEVAVAEKERENVEKASGCLSNRGPTKQEQGDVQMASDIVEAILERGSFELLSSKDSGVGTSKESEDFFEIFPSKGPIKGGTKFVLVFEKGLPPGVESVRAYFGEKAFVDLKMINEFNLVGRTPASDKPGTVKVRVQYLNGILPGETEFVYYREDQETLKRLVTDPKLQTDFFRYWALSEGGKTEISLEGQEKLHRSAGFSQPTKLLSVLVYAAARYDSKQFLEMIFSSSAGRAVFLTYKDNKILPESVPKDYCNNKIANYLWKINKRFSEEIWDHQEFPLTVDWLELVRAAEEAQRRPNLNRNPTAEEGCCLLGVAKKEGTNQEEGVSFMNACMEFVGQDLDRLELKPKVNEQERGENSSQEYFLSVANKEGRDETRADSEQMSMGGAVDEQKIGVVEEKMYGDNTGITDHLDNPSFHGCDSGATITPSCGEHKRGVG